MLNLKEALERTMRSSVSLFQTSDFSISALCRARCIFGGTRKIEIRKNLSRIP
jgi:hypothetical protein